MAKFTKDSVEKIIKINQEYKLIRGDGEFPKVVKVEMKGGKKVYGEELTNDHDIRVVKLSKMLYRLISRPPGYPILAGADEEKDFRERFEELLPCLNILDIAISELGVVDKKGVLHFPKEVIEGFRTSKAFQEHLPIVDEIIDNSDYAGYSESGTRLGVFADFVRDEDLKGVVLTDKMPNRQSEPAVFI